MTQQFHIVARPMAWRFAVASQPAPRYRTRNGWTHLPAAAIRFTDERIARLDAMTVRPPSDFTVKVEPV